MQTDSRAHTENERERARKQSTECFIAVTTSIQYTIHNALTRATHDQIYEIHVCRVRIVICAICTLLIAIELYRMLMTMMMIYNIKERHYFGNRFTIQN